MDFGFEFLTTWGIKLLIAIFIFVIGYKLIKTFGKWLKNSPKLDKLDDSLRSFLRSFSTIALYAVLVITVAMILGVPATSFITILASCGVAIGLALQGALSNFAGGLMILFFKPFKVGDYIEASGESGTVVEISVVYTEILTPDNKRITIPNGTLTNSVIENYSAEDLRRVDLKFTTAYSCDIGKVKEVLREVVSNHPLALKNPEPFVRLSEHSDSALTYTVRVWCKSEDYWDLHFDLMENVKEAFDKNGVEIPYPQMDVHVTKD
ncbi:MAG: mechanosensitive ion channel family protein [Clostridia bacterium]|nr:mechanosensitive ion channel family protein [Clostridia bacterium]